VGKREGGQRPVEIRVRIETQKVQTDVQAVRAGQQWLHEGDPMAFVIAWSCRRARLHFDESLGIYLDDQGKKVWQDPRRLVTGTDAGKMFVISECEDKSKQVGLSIVTPPELNASGFWVHILVHDVNWARIKVGPQCTWKDLREATYEFTKARPGKGWKEGTRVPLLLCDTADRTFRMALRDEWRIDRFPLKDTHYLRLNVEVPVGATYFGSDEKVSIDGHRVSSEPAPRARTSPRAGVKDDSPPPDEFPQLKRERPKTPAASRWAEALAGYEAAHGTGARPQAASPPAKQVSKPQSWGGGQGAGQRPSPTAVAPAPIEPSVTAPVATAAIAVPVSAVQPSVPAPARSPHQDPPRVLHWPLRRRQPR